MKKLLLLPLVACLALGAVAPSPTPTPSPSAAPSAPDPKIAALEQRVQELQGEVASLRQQRDSIATQLLDTQLQVSLMRRTEPPTPTPPAK